MCEEGMGWMYGLGNGRPSFFLFFFPSCGLRQFTLDCETSRMSMRYFHFSSLSIPRSYRMSFLNDTSSPITWMAALIFQLPSSKC